MIGNKVIFSTISHRSQLDIIRKGLKLIVHRVISDKNVGVKELQK